MAISKEMKKGLPNCTYTVEQTLSTDSRFHLGIEIPRIPTPFPKKITSTLSKDRDKVIFLSNFIIVHQQ